jgi:hypothetical protein
MSFGFDGSREMGLYLAKTLMPKSAVALAIVDDVCDENLVLEG